MKCVSVVFRVLAQILGHQITHRNLFSISLWPFIYGQKTKFQTHNFIFSSIFFFYGSIVDEKRKWQPTPVFLPGKSHGHRSLAGYSPRGCKRVRRDLATRHHHQQQQQTVDLQCCVNFCCAAKGFSYTYVHSF